MKIKKIIKESILNCFKEESNKIIKIINNSKIDQSDTNIYEFESSIAINLSNCLHMKPEEIAKLIKKNIEKSIYEQIEIVYPGKIIFKIKKEIYLLEIKNIIKENVNYGKNNIGNNRTINISFLNDEIYDNISSLNLYKSIFSDDVSRILNFIGFNIKKSYFIQYDPLKINKDIDKIKKQYLHICNSNDFNDLSEDDNDKVAYNIYRLFSNTQNNDDDKLFKEELLNQKIKVKKEALNKYRIFFDEYIIQDYLYEKGLYDRVLDTLNRKGVTYFDHDNLWLKIEKPNVEDIILIDKDGNYSKFLLYISYLVDRCLSKYDGIIEIFLDQENEYSNVLKYVLDLLGYDINNIDIKYVNIPNDNHYILENINKLRYNIVNNNFNDNSSNDNDYYDRIEKILFNIQKMCKEYKKSIVIIKNIEYNVDVAVSSIINKLYYFDDIIVVAGLKKNPNLISKYLNELVDLIELNINFSNLLENDYELNNFYLNFLLAIRITILNALDLLGIIPSEEI